MLYSLIIRQAVEQDAAAIHNILQEAFQEYGRIIGQIRLDALQETVDDIRREIAEKAVFVAAIDDEIVGTVRLDIHKDRAYLSRFAVGRSSRNIGIGKALMNVVDKYLLSMGVREVTLHTASQHAALMRFYYGRGFFVEAVETDRGYLRARLRKEYVADKNNR